MLKFVSSKVNRLQEICKVLISLYGSAVPELYTFITFPFFKALNELCVGTNGASFSRGIFLFNLSLTNRVMITEAKIKFD